jgi:hypothetical protein
MTFFALVLNNPMVRMWWRTTSSPSASIAAGVSASATTLAEIFSRLRAADPEPRSDLEYLNPYTLLVAVTRMRDSAMTFFALVLNNPMVRMWWRTTSSPSASIAAGVSARAKSGAVARLTLRSGAAGAHVVAPLTAAARQGEPVDATTLAEIFSRLRRRAARWRG